jgi:hypothetical protein
MWEPRRLTTLWASTACYRDIIIIVAAKALRIRGITELYAETPLKTDVQSDISKQWQGSPVEKNTHKCNELATNACQQCTRCAVHRFQLIRMLMTFVLRSVEPAVWVLQPVRVGLTQIVSKNHTD